jgi:hypothetical protein
MTNEAALFESRLHDAVHKAISEIGLNAFKALPMFGSNEARALRKAA